MLHARGESQTRLLASTDNPQWYAGRLAVLPHRFEVTESAELRSAVAKLGSRLLAAAGDHHQDHSERVRLTPAT